LFALLLSPFLKAQQNNTSTNCPGVPGACGYTTSPNNQRSGPNNPSPQNGNGTLGVIYSQQACGLDFTTASQRLGRRGSLAGVLQPAPFVIAGIPACAVIEKAYLWAEGSGNGAAQTATLAGPFGTQAFPMAIVGQGPDKCWGYSGTYTYRADVTAIVQGNGTYNISGILTNPPTAGNDMDGATLLVVWSLPTATWAGRIVIADGAIVVNGGVANYNMPISPAVCGATTNARAFIGVGDIQFNPTSWSANGSPIPLSWNWWNFMTTNTTVANGATTSNFNVNTGGDCFNLCISGLYFRTTTCLTCPSAAALSVTPTSNAATCSNCNGSATVSVTPVGVYNYSWAPTGGNAATATGLCPGTYTVTITQPPCISFTQIITIANNGSAVNVSNVPLTNVSCFGVNDGTATANASGGTGPYTFTWSPTVTTNNTTTSSSASGLGPGTYVVTATDVSGCTGTQTYVITEPTQLTATTSSTPTTCGQTNGSIDVTTSGGTGTPLVLWSPGGYTTNTVSNLGSGTYNVIVTDNNGCTATATTTIAPSTSLSSVPSSTDLLCFNDQSGTASVAITGNNGPVTYTWTPNVSSGNSATNLSAGTYVVDVVDPTGCTVSSTITLTEPPVLTTAVGGFNVSCFGACDGQVVVIPTGGTGNYSFAWNNACNQPSCNAICAGNYSVTVTDQNGCTSSGTTTVTEPTQIVVTTSFDTAHCGQADGNAYSSATGGTGALNYLWLPATVDSTLSNVTGGTYTVVVTDANGCSDTIPVNVVNQAGVVATIAGVTPASCFGSTDGNATATYSGGNGPYTYNWSPSSQTTPNASALGAGQYVVTATDANGCTSTATAVITEPAQLTLQVTATPSVVCEGTPVTLTATPGGGNPGYTVNWMPINQQGNTQTIVPTASGPYTVDLTDINGCTAQAVTNVVVNPMPTAILLGDSLAGCAPLCVNFSDLTTVSSGTITTWLWDFGDQTNSTSQNPSHCYPIAGQYNVTLTSTTNAGCVSTIAMTNYIDVFGIPTAAFTATPQPTTELNPTVYFTDQSIGASIWTWSFGDLTASSSSLQNPSFTYPGSGCFDVVLEVESSNGCTDTTMEEICIDPDVAIYVPNTFTPNGDGVNEIFFAQGIGINTDKFELWVFDRWGNMIFYSKDINDGWDGTVQGNTQLCQEDTYVWKIKCIDIMDKKHNLIGHVNLIR